MAIGDDIARLRAENAPDDEILKAYREHYPDFNTDIDYLLNRGDKAKDILDSLAQYHDEADRGFKPPDGALETSRKALQFGAAQAAVGLGRTAHWAGEASGIDLAKDVGDTITGFGKSIAPADYKPASADFFDPKFRDKGLGGFGWSHLPRTVLESVPGLLMDIGAGAATGGAGFVASNAARTFGPTMDARIENNGGKPAEASDYAIAAGSAGLQAYLNKVGINPALNSFTKGAGLAAVSQIPGQVAKAGAVDAAAGAAGNVVEQAGLTVGTDKGLTVDPHQIAGAAAASGAMGGAVRGVKGIGDVTNAVRFKDIDPEVGSRLANRFDRLGIATDTPDRAFHAIRAAEDTLTSEATRARKDLFMQLGRKDSDKHQSLISDVEVSLDLGHVLGPHWIERLHAELGSGKLAQNYIAKIEERSALNDVKLMGRMDENYFAGGLSSSRFAEETLNPASWLRSPTKQAIGSAATIASLGSEAAMATQLLHPVALMKGLAAQTAAYGALRGVDALTGSRNPAHELRKRLGNAPGDLSPFPQQPQRANEPRERLLTPEEDASVMGGIEKALQEPVQPQGRPEVGMGSKEKPKAADEAPKDFGERNAPGTVSITERGYTVNRSTENIANINRYVAKTKDRMSRRIDFGEDLELAASGHTSTVRGLINRLNDQARSFAEAQSMIEDAIQSLPWDKQSAAWDAYTKHEAALMGTYAK